jgi:hypothetical protein
MRTQLACFALVNLLWAFPADAATMTFTGLPNGDYTSNTIWIEDGITANTITDIATGGVLGSFGTPDRADLTDDGSSNFASTIDFTMKKVFRPISFDLLPGGIHYCVVADPDIDDESNCPTPYINVLLQGFNGGGHLVASDTFFMGTTDTTYQFGPEWKRLSKLRITDLRGEEYFSGEHGSPQFAFCQNGGDVCAEFEIDNVTLVPVPLPPAILLFATALGILPWLRYRTAKRAGPVELFRSS